MTPMPRKKNMKKKTSKMLKQNKRWKKNLILVHQWPSSSFNWVSAIKGSRGVACGKLPFPPAFPTLELLPRSPTQ